MTQYIGYFSSAIVVIAVVIFMSVARKRAFEDPPNTDRMNFVVRASRLYKGVGISCAALFAFCLVGSSFSMVGDPYFPFTFSVFVFFFAMGLFITVYSYRWKLVVAEDELLLTPLFGSRRRYSVRDVTHIKAGRNLGIRVFADTKKLFSVDSYSVGSAMLISYFIEKGVRAPDRINM